jgi:hypothetical protein
MCRAELLTCQWDSEVSRRFQRSVLVRDLGEACHPKVATASHGLGSMIAKARKNVESEKLRTAEILPKDLASVEHTSCGQRSWLWSEDLDALIAAPEYHALLFENECVRVPDVLIPVGRTVPAHTHYWPSALYPLSAGDFIRRDPEGRILLDTRTTPPQTRSPPPSTHWSPPLPLHSVENVGKTNIRVVSVEIKNQS